jgi:RNA polymerase sigma factor for flagellar operon FliA
VLCSVSDADERKERIRRLLPLVRKIARRVHRIVPMSELDDLVGDGCVGLVRAVDHFDPSRGPSLEQYARHLICGAILNGLRRMDPVSERARRMVRIGESERYRIAAQRGALPTNAEMETLCPGLERATLATHRGTPLSLDAPLPEGERLGRDWESDPAAIVCDREERASFWRMLDELPARQQQLVTEHYRKDRTLREVAKGMRISPQRASQLHIRALSRLRSVHAAAP